MRFETGVDWWYYLLVFVLAAVVVPLVGWRLKRRQLSVPWSVLIVVLTLGLPVWLLVSTGYRVTSTELQIRSGPLSWDIELTGIRAARLTRSSRSSPALSLDRIEILYGSGQRVLVSPKDKAAFLEAIGHPRSGD